MSETLTPERAVRLLRAKAAELEEVVRQRGLTTPVEHLAADVALIASLLADHIERVEMQAVQWNEAQP